MTESEHSGIDYAGNGLMGLMHVILGEMTIPPFPDPEPSFHQDAAVAEWELSFVRDLQANHQKDVDGALVDMLLEGKITALVDGEPVEAEKAVYMLLEGTYDKHNLSFEGLDL